LVAQALNDNAQQLLEKRYLQEDDYCWEDICHRVAGHVGQDRNSIGLYYDVMSGLDFVPSTPCLVNAGVGNGQLSSCFILDIDDSIEDIMSTVGECAKVFQSGGGAGFNISKLRPKGDKVHTAGGYSSGPVSFMELFNTLVDVVKQGNAQGRKGAIKIDLNAHHPDIFEFVDCKKDTSNLNNMNISVSCSDEFMNAVLNDEYWTLEFNGVVYEEVRAKDLWKKIVENAWATGEPGVSFRSNMERGNVNKHLGEITGSNPCAEYVNIPYSSCNLGSINLEKCLKGNYKIYWDKLANLVDIGIRFISDMIDVNNLPLREIEATTNQIRSAGLGTMGYANMLYKLNIPYGSKEAAELTDKLYSYIYEQALATNKSLAEEKGVYPAWRGSKWEQQGIEVNLSDMLSIAPNGSIAFLAGTTGGIEPEFALVYERETSEGDIYYNVNKVFEERLRSEGLYTEELMKKVANNNGSCQGIDEIPQHIQDVFVTANDLSHLDHVKAIEPIAKHVDLSIAKTVNLPVDSTPSDIGETYMTAWKSGIKGITVYRQGSREGVLRAGGSSTKLNRGEIIEPLERAPAERIRLKTACGTLWFIPVFDEDGNIIEIFTETKSGGCKSSIEALSRQCSLALRSGAPVSEVIDQLLSADACTAYTRAKESRELSDGHSCPSAMALKLRELSQGGVYNNEQEAVCPACDAPLNFSEGCLTCRKCGWSKCS